MSTTEKQNPFGDGVAFELVDLPSGGRVYSKNSPFSRGYIEMKYATAKEEDILMNESFLRTQTTIDKFLRALLPPKVNLNELLVVDRDALILGSRIVSYGPEYEVRVKTPSGIEEFANIDLREIKPKALHPDFAQVNENKFVYKTESGDEICFKLLTVSDEKEIENMDKTFKRNRNWGELFPRLLKMIVSVNGENSPQSIEKFLSTKFLAKESRAFRNYLSEFQPGFDIEIELIDGGTGEPFRTQIPFGRDLLYPDLK